jgi:hypothetical protein
MPLRSVRQAQFIARDDGPVMITCGATPSQEYGDSFDRWFRASPWRIRRNADIAQGSGLRRADRGSRAMSIDQLVEGRRSRGQNATRIQIVATAGWASPRRDAQRICRTQGKRKRRASVACWSALLAGNHREDRVSACYQSADYPGQPLRVRVIRRALGFCVQG